MEQTNEEVKKEPTESVMGETVVAPVVKPVEKIVHKIVIEDPTEFINALAFVNEFIDEAVFKFNQEGFSLVSFDKANVAMVVYKFKASGFSEYVCPADTDYFVNLDALMPFLKAIKGSKLQAVFSDNIKLNGIGKKLKMFTCSLLADIEKKQKEPPMKFDARIKIDAKDIKEAIADAGLVGESIQFKASKDNFSVNSMSELNSADIKMLPTEIIVGGDGEVNAKYAVEYLKKMIQGSKLSKEVILNFSSGYPIKMEFNNEASKMYIVLAPRVDNS